LAQAGYRVVAPFLRGYAPTEVPTHDTKSLDLASDVIALIEAFGVEKAPIIGHDWGSEAVYGAAGLKPERVSKMIAGGAPHRYTVGWSPGLAWGVRHFALFQLPGATDRFLKNDYAQVGELFKRWSPTWKYTEADVQGVRETLPTRENANAAFGYYRSISVTTPKFMRAKITVPSLCILGSDDPNVDREMGERARKQFEGPYEVAMIPGGHFCHREAPDAFLAAALPFLKK
jgi:pimeloyl-ACP methyl ester carboxylesterase